MEHMNVDLDLEFEYIFKPRLSGHLMDAYYAELMQKQEDGIKLTREVQSNTFDEVLRRFILYSPIGHMSIKSNAAIPESKAAINLQ